MITYQREDIRDCWDDCYELCKLQYAEVALNQDIIPLDPDQDQYYTMQGLGWLHVWTARDDNRMVAYHFGIYKGGLHYKSTIHAVTDIYYILPEYRKNGVGAMFFQLLEQEFKRLGVIKWITGCKVHLDHTRFFEALGFNKVDFLFSKILISE